jgi:thermitase
MKPHIVVKLYNTLNRSYPHWQNVAMGIDQRVELGFLPQINEIFQRFQLSFLTTQEYNKNGQVWSLEEIQAGLNRIFRLILCDNVQIPMLLIQQINQLPEVESVKIGGISQSEIPEHSSLSFSTSIKDWARQAIFLSQAHLFTRGLSEIKIAVLDTGVDIAHQELQDTLSAGFDFVDIIDGADTFIGDYLGTDATPIDEVGHGTHVAGIIGGRGINMPIGIAPKCKIIPVRVLASMEVDGHKIGAGLIDNINNGIKWAVDQGVSVINMSLGVKHEDGGLPHEEAIQYALSKNVSIVAASGNDGKNELYYPGALPGVLAVGATDRAGQTANFSTYGRHLTLCAPGVDIFSSFTENAYAFSTGTSHAAPFVSGSIALLRSFALEKGYNMTNKQILHILKMTSDKFENKMRSDHTGYGQVNPSDALRYLNHKIKNL